MSAPNPDTRSIGQVLYDTTKQPGWPVWEVALASMRDRYERAAEVIAKRNFDAGIEYQKTAAPPPRAKELLRRLVALELAARDFIAAQSSHSVSLRTDARARLDAALEGRP